MAAYEAVRRKGLPSVRANLMFSPAWPNIQAEDVRDLLLDWGRWLGGRGMGDEYLPDGWVLYKESDYSHENCLRAECGPYTGWAGFNFDSALPEDVMLELMIEAAKNGIRVGSFTENILDLYETVNKQAPIGDQRWLIEHIGMYTNEIARIKDLGLVLQAYSNRWIHYEGESLRETHGAENVDLYPANARPARRGNSCCIGDRQCTAQHVRSHLARGGTQDRGIRRTSRHRASALSNGGLGLRGPRERVANFEEDVKGTLEPGKYADIAILSDDLLTIPEDDIPNITSVLTMTGGRVVHSTLAA